MAEVEISNVLDRSRYVTAPDATTMAIETATEAVKSFRAAELAEEVDEAATYVADLSNQIRQDAESFRDAGDPDPMVTAVQSREQALARQELKVTEEARRRFQRYQTAVMQGATNSSAARIAVQKEMRDLIARNPAYAAQIRQAAAHAMGEEEFLVLSRDLPTARAEQKSEFAKAMDQAAEVVNAKAQLYGWDERTRQNHLANAQRNTVRLFELQAANSVIEHELTADKVGAGYTLDMYRQNASLQADVVMQELADSYISTPGGRGLSPEIVQNTRVQIGRTLQALRSNVEQALAGNTSMSQTQKNEEIAAAIAPLQQVYALLDRDDAGAVLENYKRFLDNGVQVSFAQSLPIMYGVQQTFGDSSPYILDTLSRGDMLSNLVLQNSPSFVDAQRLYPPGIANRAELIRNHILHSLTNKVGSIARGTVVPTPGSEAEGEAGTYLGLMGGTPVQTRNVDRTYQSTIDALVDAGSSLVPAELANATQLDDAQKRAAKRYGQEWNRVQEQLKETLEKYRSRTGTDAVVRVVTNPDGLPEVVIERMVTGREFSSTGEERDVVRRQAPIRDFAATEAYRRLFMSYGVSGGRQRAPVDNPAVRQEALGSSTINPAQYLDNVLYKLNGRDLDEVEWLN